MTLPEFKHKDESKTTKELVRDILEAIAIEELAIAHLINAQAEKIQSFTGPYGGFPTSPTNKQIIEFQCCVARIIESLADKQKMLIKKMELSKELLRSEEDEDDDIFE